MIRVLFICLGNICRSPMAEFVLREMVIKQGLRDKFVIASAGTSAEELGSPVHPGTRQRLAREGISCAGKTASRLTSADAQLYDYFICMDDANLTQAKRILKLQDNSKIFKLLDFTESPRAISDPWYTGDFDKTYNDVLIGCEAFLTEVLKKI